MGLLNMVGSHVIQMGIHINEIGTAWPDKDYKFHCLWEVSAAHANHV